MIIEHLSQKEIECVNNVIEERYPQWQPHDKGFIRFWDAEEIQLDGNFKLEDLKILVEVMLAVEALRMEEKGV